MDFDGPWHGTRGPHPGAPHLPRSVAGTCQGRRRRRSSEAGWKFIQDQNAEWEDGYFPITISNAYERRVSAAIGYLDPGTRLRENLTISTDTQVSGLIFDGQRCVGVKATVAPASSRSSAATRSSCRAARSIRRRICMRAGIGPAAHLRDLGIEVRAALPGRGPAVAGSSGGGGRGVPQAARADHPRLFAAAHLCGAALFVEAARHPARRHVHRGDQQDVVARGRRADRFVHHHRLQDLFGNRRGEAAVGELARRAVGRLQPAVGPTRPGADDGRRAPVRRDAPDAGHAERDGRSVPGQLQRQGAPGRAAAAARTS